MSGSNSNSLDIPPYAMAFYVHTIDLSAKLAVASFSSYSEELADERDPQFIAGELQNALVHCAAISRFFFPMQSGGEFGRKRGELLRRRFGIEDNSPFADRNLRNSLEHFDERLDNWIRGNPVGPIIGSPIIADHTLIDNGFGHVFKLVDPDNDVFIVLGVKHEFGALARAAYELAYPGYLTAHSESGQ